MDWKIQPKKNVNFPKFTYRFKWSLIKIPAQLFVDMDKLILKLT